MIKVTVELDDQTLARMDIEATGHWITVHDTNVPEYIARLEVDTGPFMGYHKKSFYSVADPRTRSVQLVSSALSSFSDFNWMILEGSETQDDSTKAEALIPPALERGLDRTVPEI